MRARDTRTHKLSSYKEPFKFYVKQWVVVGVSFPGKRVLRMCTVQRY